MATPIIAGTIRSFVIEGGDAAEMQTRLAGAIASQGASYYLVDLSLAGVGVGPRWFCHFAVSNDSGTGTYLAASTVLVLCVTAADATALDFKIDEVVSSFLASSYVAVRVAGAGAGRDLMAVIIGTVREEL